MAAAHDDGTRPRPPLLDAKQRLRDTVLAARSALTDVARADASDRIAARLVATPRFAGAGTVMLTMPFRGEWDTQPLVDAALRAGKRVVLPRVDAGARMLVLHAVSDVGRELAAGFAGIAEPSADAPRVEPAAIDWVLVPGLAFDDTGRRLGYGGGFYDRLLPLMRPDAQRAAGAFDEQVVTAVPVGPHDARIDELATPTRHWTW
ncbi:MAG: 5-formyltetrahydrofolate cyclo-ligase [Proteobacteria bacterium]|nr:5-formyltetrahydrofolate cyclo-ligase [Pseudomonadota bacterium]